MSEPMTWGGYWLVTIIIPAVAWFVWPLLTDNTKWAGK